jgi:SAM-dependent methyltransferase
MKSSKFSSNIFKLFRKVGLKLWLSYESDPSSNPLWGDTCVLYAFIIKNLINLDKNKFKTVLDVGCYRSPLTPIIKEIGFSVDGIDILPSPASYEGVNYIQGDFISKPLKNNYYDIVVMCYVISHIGLGSRFKAGVLKDGDLKAIEKVEQLLKPRGILIITIPYGKEKIVMPWHRVYNKNGKLLQYIYHHFDVITEEFYKNNLENIWVKCEESEAKNVEPSEDNYALGLFVFRKRE